MSGRTELNKRDSDITFCLHNMKWTIIHTFCTLTHSYNCIWIFLLPDTKISLHQSEKFGHKDNTTSLPFCGVESKLTCQYQMLTLLQNNFNPLQMERRLVYLKTQFVLRSKDFSSQLQKRIILYYME
jgi:hypothetical protein